MQSFFEWVSYEFNRTFIRDSRWTIFLSGLENTLLITLIASLIGIAIGTVIAVVHNMAISRDERLKRSAGSIVLTVLDKVLSFYVAVMRGTPLAIQLTIMAFIIMAGYPNKVVVCMVAFGLNSAAYVSEVIRGGIGAVDKGQMEAGRSLGMGRIKCMRLIVLPQAMANILPALCNEGIAVLKETSIIGLISVVDLTRASDLVRSRTLSPYFPLISVAIVYFVLVWGLSQLVNRLERHMNKAKN
ncbi:MAG: amino acid ABC transporter permease [Clostridia bacterium]|nr:amino acid ABC transporter permease [Clostridia bacterium]MBQ8972115.1 amino acid ABC transporter permease [Clostridia bacterium]